MSRLLLGLAIGLFAPLAVFAQSLTGVYDVHGRNPDGSPYSGTARIDDDGETVSIQWNTSAGAYSGQGHRDGKILLIDWGDTYYIVYVVMDDGDLHGTWADGYGLDRLSPR